MESGSPIPVGDITDGQGFYDSIVQSTGCSSASDTLACLRTVSYDDLTEAINQTPSIFSYRASQVCLNLSVVEINVDDASMCSFLESVSVLAAPGRRSFFNCRSTNFGLSRVCCPHSNCQRQVDNYLRTILWH
jgi:hypothetical protein